VRSRTRLALALLASAAVLVSVAAPASAAPSPTELVADLVVGPGSSSPESLTVLGSRIYFVADDGGGAELFVSDGSVGSATNLNLNPTGGSDPQSLTVIGSTLYFSATNGVDGTELWSVTAGGTPAMVADIETGAGGSDPNGFTLYNGGIYFQASTTATGQSLFRLVGGSVTQYPMGTLSAPSNFFVYTGYLYMSAFGVNNVQLYRLDGTNPPQEYFVSNPTGFGNPKRFAVASGLLYFLANDGLGGGPYNYELYVTDGLGTTTKLTTDIADDNGYQYFTVFNDTLYFAAGTAAIGRELGHTTGGAAPTYFDIYPGPTGSFAEGFIAYNGSLYFGADNGTAGYELMSLAGAGAPALRADINPGAGDAFPYAFAVSNGTLAFTAYGDGVDGQLWSFDGTTANQESDIVATDANVYEKVALGDYLYYNGTSTADGRELWRTRVSAAAAAGPGLAATGSEPVVPLGIAAALLVAGLALTRARRRTSETQE
jgi:ELWxxDGT repeat protein